MLPAEQQHGYGSEFSWAPESRAIAFGDSVQQKLSIVLVSLDDRGNSDASVYPVSLAALCIPPALGNYLLKIQRIEVGNDRPMHIYFWSGDQTCPPKSLDIRSSDFQPAKTGIHVRPKQKHSVMDPQ